MKLKQLKIKNVKSFRDEAVFDFHDDFNILIGTNGGGKSNLLDIITIGLKYFLFKGYYVNEIKDQFQNITGKNILAVNNDQLRKNLEKYYGNNDESYVEFFLVLENTDLNNFRILQQNIDRIVAVLGEEFSNGVSFASTIKNLFKDFDLNSLPINKEIKFKFVNNSQSYSETNIPKHIAQFLHQFFKNYDILRIASSYIDDLYVPPLLLFFSPYRNVELNNLSVTLSNFNYSAEYQKFFISSSKNSLNLTRMAIAHFSQKMRNSESEFRKEAWYEDEEVELVKKYLNKLGYDWDIRLIDKNRNTYEVELKKEGEEFPINNASSGEREIINFLFGVFAFNIRSGLIVIDEPELHLHPKWQKILLELFIEQSELIGNQFIISTHSPVFINERTYNHIFRIYRDSQNISRKATIEDKPNLRVKDLLHLINSTNNEKIYFADAVILVEGITDRVVFQRILDNILEEQNINKNIEIIEIEGKKNREKFKAFLDEFKIPNFFIGDFDVVVDLDETGEIKALFRTPENKIYKKVIKDKGSKDGKELVNRLEKAIISCDCIELQELWEHIKALRKEIKSDISEEEKKKINEFIKSKRKENIYILSKGEIEDYFPEDYKTKDLDKVIKLLQDDETFNNWKTTEEYNELKQIIIEIVSKICHRG